MTGDPLDIAWEEVARRSEMRWMSMEDATIELPARLVAEHSRRHKVLVEVARAARPIAKWLESIGIDMGIDGAEDRIAEAQAFIYALARLGKEHE